MKARSSSALVAGLLLASPLVAAEKSPEAQSLLARLKETESSGRILSGCAAQVNWNTNEAAWVYRHTGRWPVVNTFDFGHDVYSAKGGWIDYSDPGPALGWAKSGGIVSIIWHAVQRTNDGKGWTFYAGKEPGQTDFRPECIFDPGSTEGSNYIARLDQVARWLVPLRDAGVPVLWRPYHEAQGNWRDEFPGVDWHHAWFWWGSSGPETLKRLWRQMYDKFTNEYGLTNLVWVWTGSDIEGDSLKWYPGDGYVDVVAFDAYHLDADGVKKVADMQRFSTTHSKRGADMLAAKYPGKVKVLAECGDVPTPGEYLDKGARFALFSTWYDPCRTVDPTSEVYASGAHEHFPATKWKAAFADPRVLSRETHFPTPLFPTPPLLKSGVKFKAETWPGSL